jgi:2-aminoadipate transaminase
MRWGYRLLADYCRRFAARWRFICMSIEISSRMAHLKPSAIREMLKVTADPSFISFSAGNPSAELFPVKALAEVTAEIFANEASTALQYSITEGYGPLRELTKARYQKYGIVGADDDLIICSGGQQGIDLAVKCLVNEGDTILCENPSFIGALNTFRSYNTNLVGIPIDQEGMDVMAVEEALKREKNVRLIYTIPTFHNPAGTTMSMDRRKKLLELAEQYDVIVLEDSPYFELSFSGKIMPPSNRWIQAVMWYTLVRFQKSSRPGFGWVLSAVRNGWSQR